MSEKIKNMLEKIGADEEFRGKLEQSKSPEEALQVVQEAGFDFEMEEFKSLMQQALLYSKKESGQELTDEELAMVAGGEMIDETYLWCMTGVAGGFAAMLAAALAAA